ncbi:ABC1 family-domain-containing protein [Tricharina praecox]|uniref:ABC1 family-domain-containing protein n=1 Tax=Tricharina praecox TaxID=43433 RepID=UPI002220330D|nr:ABC1 family-domain-containing protein [Tricharina praecox]KAI5854626.1 ABC1 family-domain-containing protein [Tricharina praecox]
MASRRLLDLYAIANASTAIARKHLLIRSHQITHYAATSSIGLGRTSQRPQPVPVRHEATPSAPPQGTQPEGVAQDHHYAPSTSPPPPPTPRSDLSISQSPPSLRRHAPPSPETAKRLQAAYETRIPSQTADPPMMPETHADVLGQEDIRAEDLTRGLNEDSFYLRHGTTSQVLSNLPRAKIPRTAESEQPRGVTEGINSSEFVRELPQQEKAEKELEELGNQAFMSRRARGLFGVKPGLKMPQKGAQQSAENIVKPVTKPESSRKEEEDIVKAVAEEIEREQVVVDQKAIEGIAAEVRKEMNFEKFSLPQQPAVETPYQMTASRVPSSRVGRLFHYGGLAAGMAWGAASESVRRAAGGAGDTATSVMFSESNVERMVKKLSRMRGAALKLGQMMSFQDKLLPAPIQEILTRVQDSADYMPASQRDKVLIANLGPNWRDLFSEFSEVPMAAASIGQVHAGKLASNGIPVAIKIQYPGVADSISSDLNNLAVLLTASKMLPKGLYLDKTIANARLELGWECDYVREAECAKRFAVILQAEKDVFRVPRIFDEASGPQVLTMEMMQGVAVTKTIKNLSQEERDFIGTQILGLCFREVARYRFMQTDPNWTNFLWNAADKKIELLDFGASREFSADFTALYTSILRAASRKDLSALRTLSVQLGYLTGLESSAMTQAHVTSILTLAEPFSKDAPEIYDFSQQTVTDRVKEQIPLMIRERLAPPPEETYSLHRKLSGAFLLCARLGSRVRCREIFEEAVGE